MTKKITHAISNIIAGKHDKLYLGNLDAKRDWGFAPEYVQCQWLMLQQDEPDDYVTGTGESHSVREFVEIALAYSGVEIEWIGADAGERGIVHSFKTGLTSSTLKTGDCIIEIDARYFRPTEVQFLLADISKAKKLLKWEPKITFKELIKIMMDADLSLAGIKNAGEGKQILKDNGLLWTEKRSTQVMR